MFLYAREESQEDSYVPSQLSGLLYFCLDQIGFRVLREHQVRYTIVHGWSRSLLDPWMGLYPRIVFVGAFLPES